MDKKEERKLKTKTMFYGRARRIELAKKTLIGVVALILVIVIIVALISHFSKKDVRNSEFLQMKNYFASKGYVCEAIEKDGGRCYYDNKDIDMFYSFTRYNDGYVYLIRTSSYSIIFRHVLNSYNRIEFNTNSNALMGTRNKDYLCYTSEDLIGDFNYCETSNGEFLDSATYTGAVKLAINNLNEIINSSGYNRDKIINDYVWTK